MLVMSREKFKKIKYNNIDVNNENISNRQARRLEEKNKRNIEKNKNKAMKKVPLL